MKNQGIYDNLLFLALRHPYSRTATHKESVINSTSSGKNASFEENVMFRGLNTPIVMGAAKHVSNWVSAIIKTMNPFAPNCNSMALSQKAAKIGRLTADYPDKGKSSMRETRFFRWIKASALKKQAGAILNHLINAMPKPLSISLWNAHCHFRARRARAAFVQAASHPAYLDQDTLERLQNSYPPHPDDYPNDEPSRIARGEERAYMIATLLGEEWDTTERFLDVGAWSDMTCAALRKVGKWAVGVDIRANGFPNSATKTRGDFLQMDVARLGFSDNSFDCVFSFNSFEHFPTPNQALAEAIRVVRPGGYIYLNFGPLYWSEKGSHQFKTIHIPYHQCLFSQETLAAYAAEKEMALIDFSWMNRWKVTQYRRLWRQYASQLEQRAYYEITRASHLDLIECYPSCFKNKTENFDNFLVAYIEALFQKRYFD
jgi:ubiquinone/menaquinone biosynthesis C-methylase UbiE